MTAELLEQLATNGLLGLLLVISLTVIFFLYKETKKERNDRLEDMKEVWKEDVKFREELKTLIRNIFDLIRGTK